MNLEKLNIWIEDEDLPVQALFNPNKLTIGKAVRWEKVNTAQQDTPAVQFAHGQPATLSLELLFDTYELGTDVRLHTQRIFHLLTVEKHGHLHRPPICQLQWGLNDFSGFRWILMDLTQTFTLFLPTGQPARARLDCRFEQWRSKKLEAKLLNLESADVAKTHIVKRGETLSAIAGQTYNDPSRWRPIAEANGLRNPRRLTPGLELIIPKLTSGGV